MADAACGTRDQCRLTTLESAAVEQRLPRREPPNRYCRRLLVANARGLLRDHAGRGSGELRIAAASGDAEHLVALDESLSSRDLDRPGRVARFGSVGLLEPQDARVSGFVHHHGLRGASPRRDGCKRVYAMALRLVSHTPRRSPNADPNPLYACA